MRATDILIDRCMKQDEIAGNSKVREARAEELVNWFVRYAGGSANPKWLEQHAFELAHYVAELKGL